MRGPEGIETQLQGNPWKRPGQKAKGHTFAM